MSEKLHLPSFLHIKRRYQKGKILIRDETVSGEEEYTISFEAA